MAGCPVLAVKGLVLIRNGHVLSQPLTFTLEAGQAMHLKGANGSGKTTLLDTLATLAFPDSGQIFWQGRESTVWGDELRALWHYCGHIDALKREWSLLENWQWQAHLMGYDVIKEQLVAVLEQIGLSRLAHMPVGQFSKGQQRRAALAKLKLFKRPIWLLDEPFSALDAAGAQQLSCWMDQHLQDQGVVVFTTHQAYPDLVTPPKTLDLGGRHA